MKKRTSKKLYLYDIGGAVVATFFWAPLVSVVWNAIVIVATLAILGKIKVVSLSKIIFGLIIISIGGALLDFFAYILPTEALISYFYRIYYNQYLTSGRSYHPASIYPPHYGLYFMVLPIIAIGIFNYIVARKVFKLDQKLSIIVGIVMGLLTAPWLVYLYSYAK